MKSACVRAFPILLLTTLIVSRPPGFSNESDPVIFQDSAYQSGISGFIRSGHPTNKKYLVEGMTGGVCLFDYNNDGWLDIYLVNGSTVEDYIRKMESNRARNYLFKNLKDGTFVDVTDQARVGDPGWGMGCAAADFDNDGDTDLYVTNFGPNVLFENQGDGTFKEISRSSGTDHGGWSTGCSWGDFNNDGLVDLYVANYLELDVTQPPPELKGEFCSYLSLEVMCGPQGLPGAADVLYRNRGDGTFVDATEVSKITDPRYYGLGVVSFDYDNDQDLDIFVANDSTPNLLYQNQGDGTFLEVGLLSGVALNEDGLEQACMGVAVGDYDNDGNLDIFVTNFAQDTNTLYRNLGDGFFLDATTKARLRDGFPFMGWGTAFFDYDLDGWKDLMVVNGHLYPEVEQRTDLSYKQADLLYHNERNGTFSNVAQKLGYSPHVGRGAAFGDLTNDGNIDAVVSNLDDRPYLLYNPNQNESHWLLLELRGTRSNRDAIGARVWLETGGKTSQLQEVSSGSSYLSGSDLRLHFGLGTRARIEKLHIRWPRGS
ncbi:CRTAC1 family protein, partial [Acidobacteria bacterium AH-259-O06]|nr:CRTAC1 family protein [Acidobacteria bacterium AH-259-O06]